MKEKERWAEGCIEGLKMEYCRPPTEKELWLSGFEYAKLKCSEAVCECCSNPQSCLEVGEEDAELEEKMMRGLLIKLKTEQVNPIPETVLKLEKVENVNVSENVSFGFETIKKD